MGATPRVLCGRAGLRRWDLSEVYGICLHARDVLFLTDRAEENVLK